MSSAHDRDDRQLALSEDLGATGINHETDIVADYVSQHSGSGFDLESGALKPVLNESWFRPSEVGEAHAGIRAIARLQELPFAAKESTT